MVASELMSVAHMVDPAARRSPCSHFLTGPSLPSLPFSPPFRFPDPPPPPHLPLCCACATRPPSSAKMRPALSYGCGAPAPARKISFRLVQARNIFGVVAEGAVIWRLPLSPPASPSPSSPNPLRPLPPPASRAHTHPSPQPPLAPPSPLTVSRPFLCSPARSPRHTLCPPGRWGPP